MKRATLKGRKNMKRATLMAVVVALTVALTAGTALAALNTIKCPTRSDGSCVGTTGDELMQGTNRGEKIGAMAGNDVVRAYGGNDTVTGGIGSDHLYGYEGADRMEGGPGDDFIVGGPGGDTIIGGANTDRTYGGDGWDTIRVAGDSSTRDYVNCGRGRDTAYVDSNDVIDGVVAETIVVNTAFTCERIYVNGILIPTGA